MSLVGFELRSASGLCLGRKVDLILELVRETLDTWNRCQWSFLVPLIGGRYHIIPQLAVCTTYIPLIYCLLGDYISPTTY